MGLGVASIGRGQLGTITQIDEGTNQIQRVVIARELLRELG